MSRRREGVIRVIPIINPDIQTLCLRPYANHKKGCPNYNYKEGCPPNAQMFDSVCDIKKPIFAICEAFDFRGHVKRMKEKHPKWSQRQLECCLYWQGGVRKRLKIRMEVFHGAMMGLNGRDYFLTDVPEAMGVNVTETMRRVGIELEWPPVDVAYKIAMAGVRRKE